MASVSLPVLESCSTSELSVLNCSAVLNSCLDSDAVFPPGFYQP